MRPIFILSLPRSGSTLLQRMLSAHSAVASVSEPWILLPLAGVTGECDVRTYSDYSSRVAAMAARDFIAELPSGMATYREALRNMVGGLYESLCQGGEVYFVDKTPRYFLIIDFLFEIFPGAKVVFLFRHPLDVLSSILMSATGNRLSVHHWHVDMYEGPVRLHRAFQRYGGSAHALRYEELVANPEEACRGLAQFLDLQYEKAMVFGYRDVRLRGSMGDRTGDRKYDRPEQKSVDQWKTVLATAVRRRFARRYMIQLGADVLETFGVSLNEVRRDLDFLKPTWRHTAKDLYWLSASWAARLAAANVLRGNWDRRSTTIHKLD